MGKKDGIKIGVIAFTAGVILALIAGIIPASMNGIMPWVAGLLVVLGIIVGFLNVTEEETPKFLMASVSIMIAVFTAGQALAVMTVFGAIGNYLSSILANVNLFVFPATIVVAIKSVYVLAKD